MKLITISFWLLQFFPVPFERPRKKTYFITWISNELASESKGNESWGSSSDKVNWHCKKKIFKRYQKSKETLLQKTCRKPFFSTVPKKHENLRQHHHLYCFPRERSSERIKCIEIRAFRRPLRGCCAGFNFRPPEAASRALVGAYRYLATTTCGKVFGKKEFFLEMPTDVSSRFSG